MTDATKLLRSFSMKYDQFNCAKWLDAIHKDHKVQPLVRGHTSITYMCEGTSSVAFLSLVRMPGHLTLLVVEVKARVAH